MKFTINGFKQEKLLEYNLDAIDALILRYFVDFKDSGDMVIEIVNNKPYYWIKYETLIDAIPIINIKSKDVLRRRLKKLEKCKILDHYYKNRGGSYSFYRLGENYKYLIKYSTPTTQKSEGCYSKVAGGTTQKSYQNINLLKDSSIKDNIYTNDFLEWYDLYPNPWNKQQSFKNFKKLLKTESFENIMLSTKNYIAYLNQRSHTNKNYIVRSTNFIGAKKEYLEYLKIDLNAAIENNDNLKTIDNWGND
jgi:hypothetical protein